MSFAVISHLLVADVANGGTFTVNYPAPYTGGSFAAVGHAIETNAYGRLRQGAGAAFSIGASSVTITNNTGVTLLAGTQMYVELNRPGRNGWDDAADRPIADRQRMVRADMFRIDLGTPSTADADGACASQAVGNGADALINGALASGGVATFATPRNVVAGWTTTSVITVYGTDQYGNRMAESSASGTSFTGKKAFKTITRVTSSASITGLTVGEGAVLGLPVVLPETARVVKEIQDGATATAGTLAAADGAVATATTGDVRGTYAPNSAPNGSRSFALMAALDDPGLKGVAQFAG